MYLVAIAFLLATGVCHGRILHLHLHSDAAERGLVCLDGSSGGYYAHFTPGSDLWLFFLQGGGWCFDYISCVEQIVSATFDPSSNHYISSTSWSQNIDIGGLFDLLENANLVRRSDGVPHGRQLKL